jgi:4-hydroxybenzoate polyprenyltransferase
MDPFDQHHLSPTLALFAAKCLWTITYDAIYATRISMMTKKLG